MKRPCGSTYFGVNLASGRIINEKLQYDIDGKNFKRIAFEVRGSIPANKVRFYATQADASGEKGVDIGVKGSDDKFATLDTYCSGYNAMTWTKVSFAADCSTKLSAALVCSVDNNPDNWDTQWIEIRNIDWQDASGNSVVPAYVN